MKKVFLVLCLLLVVGLVYADDIGYSIPNPIDTQATIDLGLDVMIAYSGSDPLYVGEAIPGTAQSSTGWRIYKCHYSGSVISSTTWANGTAVFDKEWDERANYSY